MLTLYYTPGACSMAAHIVLEESGEEYEAKKVDLAGGEQRTERWVACRRCFSTMASRWPRTQLFFLFWASDLTYGPRTRLLK
jgi:hypothetical protein